MALMFGETVRPDGIVSFTLLADERFVFNSRPRLSRALPHGFFSPSVLGGLFVCGSHMESWETEIDRVAFKRSWSRWS